MNVQNMRKWIEALRSGKYKQSRGYLKTTEKVPGYCCLGVACDILDSSSWSDCDEDCVPGCFVFRGHQTDAPPAVWQWLDMDEYARSRYDKVYYEEDDGDSPELQTHLIGLNDRYKWSFMEIANYLERLVNDWIKDHTEADKTTTPPKEKEIGHGLDT